MGRLAKVKVGATVGQDFSFFKWPEEYKYLIFEVENPGFFDRTRRVLKRHGFGIMGKGGEAYGCGAIYVSEKSLLYEDDLGNFTVTKKLNRSIKF